MTPGGARKRRVTLIAAAGSAVALAVSGTAFAAAGFGGHHDGSHGYGPRGSLRWGFGRDSAPFGMVQGPIANNVLTVLEFDGTTTTYDVNGNTRYFLNGEPGSVSSVTQGENVVVMSGHDWGGWSGGTPTTTPTAVAVFLFSPHVIGSIQNQSSNSTGALLTLQDPQGFWHNVQTDSSTVYYVNGTSTSTAPTFTTGEIIAALGSVASDHTTLDATQINVVVPHGGFHHHHGFLITTKISGVTTSTVTDTATFVGTGSTAPTGSVAFQLQDCTTSSPVGAPVSVAITTASSVSTATQGYTGLSLTTGDRYSVGVSYPGDSNYHSFHEPPCIGDPNETFVGP